MISVFTSGLGISAIGGLTAAFFLSEELELDELEELFFLSSTSGFCIFATGDLISTDFFLDELELELELELDFFLSPLISGIWTLESIFFFPELLEELEDFLALPAST